MHSSITFLLWCTTLAYAWLPAEHGLFGTSVSNATKSLLAAGKGRTVKKWLPTSGKIRGVNLGSMFVIEPWMAASEWSDMGCGSYQSEFDCVGGLGQSAANSAFQAHWARWITESDIAEMSSYGINTIRIPVGYWIDESLVYSDSEHFPQGGLSYLEQVCDWASNYGFYIIIDLHGAPGAQAAQQPFTGQYATTAGFYVDYQYERAYDFLQNLTNIIHTNDNYRNVGMLEVVNEPISGESSLVSEYYPNAYAAIRNTESSLGIAENNHLHIQFMDASWGSGDPNSALTDTDSVAYDNHRYLKYDSTITPTQSNYLSTSCNDNVASDGDTPVVVGEWSLSPATSAEDDSEFEISDSNNMDFYQRWFAAQAMAYEKQEGWIFWSWKAQLGDYRWSYQDAVTAGAIPTDLDTIYNVDVC